MKFMKCKTMTNQVLKYLFNSLKNSFLILLKASHECCTYVVPINEKSLLNIGLQTFKYLSVTPTGFKPVTFRTGI